MTSMNKYRDDSGALYRVLQTGQIITMAPTPIIQVPARELQRYFKIMLDAFLAGLLLILFVPVFGVIALAIKLTSRGPVFFQQRRVGFRGKIFKMWKFRTMKVTTAVDDHQRLIKTILAQPESNQQELVKKYKSQIDSQITPIGHFLRKTSLDELPQILNVLRGELSLVGPRPHPVYEVERYKPWYLKRLQIMPGITGLSKVRVRCTPENYDESMRLDIQYIKSWSLGLDFKIMLQTLVMVFCMKNAY